MKDVHRAVALTIVPLVMPALYVATYLALVVPSGTYVVCMSGKPVSYGFMGNYLVYPPLAEKLYWPLEQGDRKLRPDAWVRAH